MFPKYGETWLGAKVKSSTSCRLELQSQWFRVVQMASKAEQRNDEKKSGKIIESTVSVSVAIVPTVGPRATNARAISHVRGHATVNSMQRRDSRVGDVNVTEALDD